MQLDAAVAGHKLSNVRAKTRSALSSRIRRGGEGLTRTYMTYRTKCLLAQRSGNYGDKGGQWTTFLKVIMAIRKLGRSPRHHASGRHVYKLRSK